MQMLLLKMQKNRSCRRVLAFYGLWNQVNFLQVQFFLWSFAFILDLFQTRLVGDTVPGNFLEKSCLEWTFSISRESFSGYSRLEWTLSRDTVTLQPRDHARDLVTHACKVIKQHRKLILWFTCFSFVQALVLSFMCSV